MEYTKGPWTIYYGTNQTGESTNQIYAEPSHQICDDVYDDNDAKLVAASPDMYEALRMVLKEYGSFLCEPHFEQITNAIKKATL